MFDTPLVLVSGKGGVGKSAVTAATALAALRSGKKVLSVAMIGDGGGLAAHLGSGPLQFKPQEIRPGLSALVVDRAKAMVEYLQIQIGISALAAFAPFARAFDVLASTAPAIREIVTIGKVVYEVQKGEYDLVVADAPPTGQIGSHLRAMKTIGELVPAGRILEQAAWMREILEQKTTLALVSVPEELPVTETKETIDLVGSESEVARLRIISNRVLPELRTDRSNLPSGKAGEAARLHLQLQDEQAHWRTALPSDVDLPYLFGVVTPTEVAVRLSERLVDMTDGT